MFTLKKLAAVSVLVVFFCALFISPGIADPETVMRTIDGERVPVRVEEADRIAPDGFSHDGSSAISHGVSESYVPGDVLVVFRGSQTGQFSEDGLAQEEAKIDSLASSLGAGVAETYSALSAAGGKVIARLHSDTKSELELLRELRKRPEVLGASLNYRIYAFETPDDPMYGQLWGIKAVLSDKLWASGFTGGSDVYAAVIDTGVSYTHEDLAENFEVSGYSRNFTTSDPSAYNDVNSHGSHVSGTIAGVGNNSKGVAGVNWKAKIIALKVLDDTGSGQWDWTISAMNYLTELANAHPEINLASVNLSLGGYISTSPEDMISENNPMWAAFSAFSKTNRAVICVAAGNESIEVGKPTSSGTYCYPASFRNVDNMIVVAAADNTSTYSQAYYSNYSTTYVDVSAPGSSILSTIPGNSYGTKSGTSMATPHVTGAAALLKSVYPEADAEQIKQAINQGANKNFATSYTVNGFLDVKAALDVLDELSDPTLPPEILTTALAKGIITEPYDASLAAKGARPITWSLYSGSLPSGLTLSAEGKITGTPTNPGTYTFTVRASNANGNATKSLSITVSNGIPEIVTAALPNGSVQELYSGALAAKGVKPITWSLNSGSLPPYFTLNTDGTITGAYSKSGTWEFTVKAQNSVGTASKKVSLKIAGVEPAFFTYPMIPAAVAGKPYSKQLDTAGSAPFTWTVTSGTLPAGLTLNSSTGLISGTPTKASTSSYSFTVKVQNDAGSASQTFSMYVDDPASDSDIQIEPDYMPYIRCYVPYSYKLKASGTAPITWSIVEGTLPAGITLKEDGTISGKITSSIYGNNYIKVKASNSTGSIIKHQLIRYDYYYGEFVDETLPYAVKGETYSKNLYQSMSPSGNVSVIEGELPPGIVLSSSGYFNGAPKSAGTYTFTVAGGATYWECHGRKTYTLTVKNSYEKPVITASELPSGIVGVLYNGAVAYTGSKVTSWSRTGTLPPGVSANYGDWFSGTPTTAGEYNFTVTAKNSAGSDTKNLKITIYGEATAPTITTSSLPEAKEGQAYEASLTSSGTTPITWSIIEGVLPAGLTLESSTGKISGTPSENGTFNFTVKAQNSAGSASKSLPLTVKPAGIAPVINTASPLTSGTINKSYSVTFEATGTAPITWTSTAGKLPSGVTLNSSGLISGTPTEAGTFTFTVKAENNYGSASKNYSLTIKGIVPAITTGATLSNGTVSKAYSVTLAASGTKPITWTKTGGTLPDGLILGNTTGTISGTPTKKGTFSFTVKAANVWGSSSRTFTIKILPKLTIKHVFTNAVKGVSYSDYVEVAGGTIPYTWKLEKGTRPIGLELSTKTSGRYAYLTGKPTKEGKFNFTLRATDKNGATEIQAFSMIVKAPMKLSGTFKAGSVGVPYNSSITVTGGLSDYKWKKLSGSVPKGLKLTFSGNKATLSGTPTKADTFKFTLSVTDKDGDEISKMFPVTITPKLEIKSTFAGGKVGVSYNDYVEASGGTPKYTWKLISGSIPKGLKLTFSNAKAVIKGTPKAGGSFAFTLRLTDKNGVYVDKTFTLVVMYIDGTYPATAYIGKDYTGSITVKGGTAPYTWSKSSGSFPKGLTFKGNGDKASLSGKPTKAGKYTFTVKAVDKNKSAVTKSFTVQVINPPSISGSFTNSSAGQSYSDYIEVKNGVSGYTWSIVKGKIPDGLKPASYSGTKFKLTGKPTKAGKYTFTVRVTDKNNITAEKQFTITIAAKLAVTGEFEDGWAGEEYEDHVNASGGISPYTWSKASGNLPDGVGLIYSGSEAKLYGTPSKAGKFTFTLKLTDKTGAAVTKSFTVVIHDELRVEYTFKNGKAGSKYSDYVAVNGGTAPYSWNLAYGEIPSGLTITPQSNGNYCYLKGTPSKAGTFDFTLEVTDSSGLSGMADFTIKINQAAKSALPSEQTDTPSGADLSETAGSSDSSEEASASKNADLPESMLPERTDNDTDSGSDGSGSAITLKVISDDVLEAGTDADEDIVSVRANKPVTFIIGAEVSGAVVMIDDEAVEIEVSDEGIFTIPAEIVHDDFKVSVKAVSEGYELESNELYISAIE